MKATYNFFKQERVTPEKLLAAHVRVHKHEEEHRPSGRMIVAGDTTQLDYTGNRSAKEMGPLSYAKQRGLNLHSDLMISPSGVPIGLLHQQFVVRKDEEFSQSKKRVRLPIEDKESYRWIASYRRVEEHFRNYPKLETFHVMDREADIHELLQSRQVAHVHYIIRSKHNRKANSAPDASSQQDIGIHTKVRQSPIKGKCKVKVTHRPSGKSRQAKVSIRYISAWVSIRAPKSHQKHLQPVRLHVVHALEEHPPKGKQPVEWILITSKPIEDVQEAKTIIRYYALRWLIERFHYVLKQGAKVEELQLKTLERVQNAVTTYSIVAVNLLRLSYLARHHPDENIYELGVSKREHQALYTFIKAKVDSRVTFDEKNPPNILAFTKLIARLGGYMDFTSQPFPGVKSLWRGIREFFLILEAFDAFMSMN